MLKRDVIDAVSGRMKDHYKKDIGEAVEIVLDCITNALCQGRRVEIRGFGSLSVRSRKSRSTLNPKTSKIMHIAPRKTVHFTMSKTIKDPLAGK